MTNKHNIFHWKWWRVKDNKLVSIAGLNFKCYVMLGANVRVLGNLELVK